VRGFVFLRDWMGSALAPCHLRKLHQVTQEFAKPHRCGAQRTLIKARARNGAAGGAPMSCTSDCTATPQPGTKMLQRLEGIATQHGLTVDIRPGTEFILVTMRAGWSCDSSHRD
jgi:hypothetical protein